MCMYNGMKANRRIALPSTSTEPPLDSLHAPKTSKREPRQPKISKAHGGWIAYLRTCAPYCAWTKKPDMCMYAGMVSNLCITLPSGSTGISCGLLAHTQGGPTVTQGLMSPWGGVIVSQGSWIPCCKGPVVAVFLFCWCGNKSVHRPGYSFHRNSSCVLASTYSDQGCPKVTPSGAGSHEQRIVGLVA